MKMKEEKGFRPLSGTLLLIELEKISLNEFMIQSFRPLSGTLLLIKF